MKQITLLLLSTSILTGCFKQFSDINDDNELFPKLAQGNGTWEIVEVETWDATSVDPVKETLQPKDSFFHFYLRSKIVSGTVIDLNYGELFINNKIFEEATISAQSERIIFEGNFVGSGKIYSIEEKSLNAMVWLHMENNKATRYSLKKCQCILPETSKVETGG